ncbi:DNA topoisomerase I [Candidatus Woesearchaeota archaeon]|nr:DNA topoisomerase I [Candidatus Woesearchaeota archaeon]
MYELIITEKPTAANRIAEALADGKPIKENASGVPYYKVTRGKKDIIVACAVGHLYSLTQKEGKKWNFPEFNIEWKPAGEVSKRSDFSKKYLNVIKKLSKEANEFTVATDFDVEGEVIGLNVIRYACKKKDANRMKFSTLTKPDLIEAYENKLSSLDWGQANAGETRHFLDWYNGINYSRALTSSIKAAGSFKLMSTGRVQGPALKIIVDREKEIKAFKPVPFWQIELQGDVSKGQIIAWHKEDKFWEKEKADEVIKKTKNAKEATVESTEKRQYQQTPPTPFDLTTLQIEAYRCHRISPKETLQIAQELYTSGFISYPRTSSQILSEKLGFRKIFSELARQKNYSDLINKLLSKKTLKPNNGKKADPAHPAIYPTGIQPGNLSQREEKIYDLIVKRFMATFSEAATRETATIDINCKEEIFIAKGTRTTEKGWHLFYQPYVNIEEEELPAVSKNDQVAVKKIKLHEKETQPPKRYTPASIIKELEKRNLGTKATRSEIVDTLFNRGYVTGKAIEATNLGIKTVETLETYAPKIVDEELTRHFEEEMEEIREGKRKGKEVLEEAKEAITNIIVDFKKKEKDIGKKLLEANIETRDALSNLGKCPKCNQGDLQIRRGKFGSFVACNQYPKCKTTFSLPKNTLIKPAQKSCETCTFPKVLAIRKGKQPMEFCLNPKCPTKHVEGAAGREAKAIAKGEIEKSCPECKEGNLVLRGSIYGKFYGCSNYPKCKYTEKLGEGPLKEDFAKK